MDITFLDVLSVLKESVGPVTLAFAIYKFGIGRSDKRIDKHDKEEIEWRIKEENTSEKRHDENKHNIRNLAVDLNSMLRRVDIFQEWRANHEILCVTRWEEVKETINEVKRALDELRRSMNGRHFE